MCASEKKTLIRKWNWKNDLEIIFLNPLVIEQEERKNA